MDRRLLANGTAHSRPLLDLIARRFDLRLDGYPAAHLARVREHYQGKRVLLLIEHGEAGALAQPDYAKAVLLSEAARLLLREIDPRPRKSKKTRKKDPSA